VIKTQPNSFRFDDDPSSFFDYTESWDYSSDTCIVPNKESESSLYDEGIVDQAMDTNITFQDNSIFNYRLSSKLSRNVKFSSPAVSLNWSEESNKTTFAPPVSSPLSEDDLQLQVDSSPSLPMMENRESPFISSLSLSSQESAQPSSITSKTSKGTLIFTKSLNDRFIYDSVLLVLDAPKSKSKSKGKGKAKSKSKDQLEFARSFQKNSEIPVSTFSV
jgi:hypothetical protein